MKTKTIVALAFAVCLCCLPVYGGNLLTNSGFETGDFTGWTVVPDPSPFGVQTAGFPINSAFGNMPVIVHSGTYAAYALICTYGPCQPSGNYDSLELFQTVNLVAGVTYHIGFWWGDPISQEFLNSSAIGVGGDTVNFTSYPDPIYLGWQLEDGYYTAQSTGPAEVWFGLAGSGYGDAGFSFDDFYVNSPVPEPSSLVLLGSGLLGAFGVVRRKLIG